MLLDLETETDAAIARRVGERVMWLRVGSGITEAGLAEDLCLAVTTVQSWEAGRTSPTAVQLIRLARCLEVRPGDLIDD